MIDYKQLIDELHRAGVGPFQPAELVVIQNAYDILKASDPEPSRSLYKHYKGNYYTRHKNARLSISSNYPLVEGTELVIYEDNKGRWHARHVDEFEHDKVVLGVGEGAPVPRFRLERVNQITTPVEIDQPRSHIKVDPEELAMFPRTIQGLIDWLTAIARVSAMSYNSCARANDYAEMLDMFKEYSAGPKDFRWIDEPCVVTGGDYKYTGTCLLAFPKQAGGAVRYIVMDQNRRLFIHNGDQVNLRVRRDEIGRVVEDNTP